MTRDKTAMHKLDLTRREFDMVREIVEIANPNKPYTISDVRLALGLIDKLEKATESADGAGGAMIGLHRTVLIETAEKAFLHIRLDQPQWARADMATITLVDKVANAPIVQVKEA